MSATLIDSFAGPFDAGPFYAPPLYEGLDGPFEVRLGPRRPTHSAYVRRRLMAGLVLVALCAVFGATAHSVLADRGGVPASTPAIRPVNSSVDAFDAGSVTAAAPTGDAAGAIVVPAAVTYIVQPGDTLWSIADRLRGQASISDYVDQLVSANGGAAVQAGQLLTLP